MRSLSACVALLAAVAMPRHAAAEPPPPLASAAPVPAAPTALPAPALAPAPAAPPAPFAPPPPAVAPAPPPPAPAQDPVFYVPTPSERMLAPPEPPPPFMFGVLEDVHHFVNGSIRGWSSETRVRFGGDHGVTLGTYNFDSVEVGYDAFRYRGVEVFKQSDGPRLHGYLLLPNLDMRIFVGPNRLGTAIGTSATGFRIANCALTGCFEASVRVLTVDAWYAGDFHAASFALSIGGGLSVGIKL